jgi:hypothetical protein
MKLLAAGALGLVAIGVAVLIRPRPLEPETVGGTGSSPSADNGAPGIRRSNGRKNGPALGKTSAPEPTQTSPSRQGPPRGEPSRAAETPKATPASHAPEMTRAAELPRVPEIPRTRESPRPLARDVLENKDELGQDPQAGTTLGQALVTWCVRVPEGTPADAKIYLCGNDAAVGGWDPRGVALEYFETRLYRLELPLRVGMKLEYKFTRGSWQTVEKKRDGTERPNRVLNVVAAQDLLANVEAWNDTV